MIYQAVFERSSSGSVFAYVPDLPGCTSWGETLDAAQRNVAEAVALWVEDAREQGEEIPAATTIAALPVEVSAAA